jgi:predicted nucleic acid-binding protein
VTRAELLLGAFVPSDNDLWIAATASSRGHALVTCDRDHQRIAPELPIEVVFLAPPV